MAKEPFISVIVPVYNGSQHLGQCLDALITANHPSYEIILVDDASTDQSLKIGQKKGVNVIQLTRQSGPAIARNRGVQNAKGDIILFVDSDVVIQQCTLTRIVECFRNHPHIAAVFGSYDDIPRENNFFSQYKNLHHHFVHQNSSTEANTFWAGCGAIQSDVFREIGGFDGERFPNPSIEDIELGYRLKRNGYRIFLDKKLQVTHLKKWGFFCLLRTDIFCRAVPWSKLILENKKIVKDLNLTASDRISAGLTGLSLGISPFTVLYPGTLIFILVLFGIILVLNIRLFQFFLRRNGWTFTILAFLMQLLYYLYSASAYGSMLCLNTIKGWLCKRSP